MSNTPPLIIRIAALYQERQECYEDMATLSFIQYSREINPRRRLAEIDAALYGSRGLWAQRRAEKAARRGKGPYERIV